MDALVVGLLSFVPLRGSHPLSSFLSCRMLFHRSILCLLAISSGLFWARAADDVPAEMAAHPAAEALWLGQQASHKPVDAPVLLIRQTGALLAAQVPVAAVNSADEALRKIAADDHALRALALRARAEARLAADDSHGALADAIALRVIDPADAFYVRLEHRIRARLYIDESDRSSLEPLYEIARQNTDAGPALWDYAMLLAERGRMDESNRVRELVYPLGNAPTPAILEALEQNLTSTDGPSASFILSLVARLRERDPSNPRWDKLQAEYADVSDNPSDYVMHSNSRGMEGPQRVVELAESPANLIKAFDAARTRLGELERQTATAFPAQAKGLLDARDYFIRAEKAPTAAAAQKEIEAGEAVLVKLLPEGRVTDLGRAFFEAVEELDACIAARSEVELPPARAQTWEEQAAEALVRREKLDASLSPIHEAREAMSKARETAGRRPLQRPPGRQRRRCLRREMQFRRCTRAGWHCRDGRRIRRCGFCWGRRRRQRTMRSWVPRAGITGSVSIPHMPRRHESVRRLPR